MFADGRFKALILSPTNPLDHWVGESMAQTRHLLDLIPYFTVGAYTIEIESHQLPQFDPLIKQQSSDFFRYYTQTYPWPLTSLTRFVLGIQGPVDISFETDEMVCLEREKEGNRSSDIYSSGSRDSEIDAMSVVGDNVAGIRFHKWKSPP